MADTESEATGSDSIEEQHAVSDMRRAKLAATEQSPVGTVVTDLEGRIEYASPSFQQLTGYSLDELVGTSISALEQRSSVPSDDLWAAIKGGRVWSGEFEMVRKDGSTFWGSVMIFPLRDESGSVTHFVGLNEDITERKIAHEELVRSRELIRTVTESTTAAAFIYRRSGLAYANPAAAEMTGYTREELMKMNFLDIVHHDHRELIGERIGARFEGRPQPSRYEFKMTRKNGDDLWVDCAIGGVIDFEGHPAIVGTAVDVTDRKRSEEALRSAREDLERRTEEVSQPASIYDLTFRELTVLSVMAEGRQDREIAELLGISHRTVQAHVASILKKMNARTRTDASVRAQKEGLIG